MFHTKPAALIVVVANAADAVAVVADGFAALVAAAGVVVVVEDTRNLPLSWLLCVTLSTAVRAAS